jgi:hypothetical protein
MFIILQDHFNETRHAINAMDIESITDYDTGSKIICKPVNGSRKYFNIKENVEEVVEKINKLGNQREGSINIYHRRSQFDS